MTMRSGETMQSKGEPQRQSRKVWWLIGIAILLAIFTGIVVEEIGRPASIAYGALLDQLEADNIADVTFRGTEISGRFKRPLGDVSAASGAQRDTFSSHVPDFGDPTLISELRKHHVVIDVAAAPRWISLLAGLPWPMVLFVGAAIIAALIRLLRGGKAATQSTTTMQPMQATIAFVSGLFAKSPQAANAPAHEDEEPKSR